MNDITALMATMKAAAENLDGDTWHDEGASVYGGAYDVGDTVCYDHIVDCENVNGESLVAEFIAIANPANVLALVEALEKAQQSVELVDLQRDKIKRLESDLWDKEQLRKVHSEKSFELEGKVRELEARNQKDFVWRGKEISRLNDEVDELKEKLESRTVTVKLPTELELRCCERCSECAGNALRVIDSSLRAAGIQVIEGEGQ